MELPEFLVEADGEIRLTGHRIGLYHIVLDYNEGDSAEMLACRYPSLPLSLVHKVIAYYLENRRAVDEYVAECQAEMDEQRRVGRHVDLDALRQRLQLSEPSLSREPHAS